MLSDNLHKIRKLKGMTQEELAAKLNVVRQTVSKWEKGTSIPDSNMLIEISNQLDTPIESLLGETAGQSQSTPLPDAFAETLSLADKQSAHRSEKKRRLLRGISIAGLAGGVLCAVIQLFPVINFCTSTAIIGGADGPTAIYTTSSYSAVILIVISVITIALCTVGIIATRKKRA